MPPSSPYREASDRALDRALPPLAAPTRLGLLVATGGAVYAGWLLVFARTSIAALLSLVRPRPAA